LPNYHLGKSEPKPLKELLSLKSAQLGDLDVRRKLAEEVCALIEESASLVRDHVAYPGLMVPIDVKIRVSSFRQGYSPTHAYLSLSH